MRTIGRYVLEFFYSVIFPWLMQKFSRLVPAYCFENWECLSGAGTVIGSVHRRFLCDWCRFAIARCTPEKFCNTVVFTKIRYQL